ncbi:MAG: Asp-tRNA(Asn)/Glu-tRNA(Gln) amidotransferase subunit GatB, partial [Ruminococcaceae bacterium]|nr:Asp-tRNA(Asn)/Glu-tRNA(Gln) amidotransferase subunit GatB [Oscillospiraceae bacterium]
SEPDFRTAAEVSAYLEKLCAMFRYADISDCKMQEGSLRADVNISVRPKGGSRLGTRTELKNLNSFKAIERAIAYESARQIKVLERGGTITQETRRWDDAAGVSLSMRSKENAQDYRYFPEPDLPPLDIPPQTVDELRATLPEFAEARAARFGRDYGLSAYEADLLCADRDFADLFEAIVAAGAVPKEVANWMLGTVRKCLNDAIATPQDIRLSPSLFAAILSRVGQGSINRVAAVTMLEEFLLTDRPADFDLDRHITDRGLAQIRDDGAVARAVAQVFAANPAAIEDYRAGKKRAEGFLIGQTMKAMQGRADPAAVGRAVKEALQKIES